jgi:hypothetical protein
MVPIRPKVSFFDQMAAPFPEIMDSSLYFRSRMKFEECSHLGPLEGAGTIFVLSELKDDWQSLENQES